jgi:hypothetical protein
MSTYYYRFFVSYGGNDLLGHVNHQLIADNLRSMIRMAGERGVAAWWQLRRLILC